MPRRTKDGPDPPKGDGTRTLPPSRTGHPPLRESTPRQTGRQGAETSGETRIHVERGDAGRATTPSRTGKGGGPAPGTAGGCECHLDIFAREGLRTTPSSMALASESAHSTGLEPATRRPLQCVRAVRFVRGLPVVADRTAGPSRRDSGCDGKLSDRVAALPDERAVNDRRSAGCTAGGIRPPTLSSTLQKTGGRDALRCHTATHESRGTAGRGWLARPARMAPLADGYGPGELTG